MLLLLYTQTSQAQRVVFAQRTISVSLRALSLSCPCPDRGYEIILALTALVRMHRVAL